jgi:hypothetical protein
MKTTTTWKGLTKYGSRFCQTAKEKIKADYMEVI